MVSIANDMDNHFSGTKTLYLDANFPFYEGFPLLPHLSHDDGEKLDLAFYYKNTEKGSYIDSSPSFIGYGIYETPEKEELNYTDICSKKGHWQYGILGYFIPKWNAGKYELDEKRTATLIKKLGRNENISKIFIEPHLKSRWKLSKLDKIRFHGCHAVRHDDHIHIQL